MIISNRTKLVVGNYDPNAIRHPEDESIIKWMERLPKFKTFLTETVGSIREAYCDVEAYGDGFGLTKESAPKVYALLEESCKRLCVKKVPKFNSEWLYYPTSYSAGQDRFRISLSSGAIDLLDDEELVFLISHELGHYICGHKPYQMLLEALYLPMADIKNVKIWSTIIKVPLLDWYRKSDFTADRFGLLGCQDINVALRVMIKKAGLPKKCYNEINVNAFLRQALDFENKYSGNMDSLAKSLSLRSCEFPWMVHRAAELCKWYKSGEYDKIINKNR